MSGIWTYDRADAPGALIENVAETMPSETVSRMISGFCPCIYKGFFGKHHVVRMIIVPVPGVYAGK